MVLEAKANFCLNIFFAFYAASFLVSQLMPHLSLSLQLPKVQI